MTMWWLSFSGDEGFRGVAIVESTDFGSAVVQTHVAGINPGGSVKGFEFPPEPHDAISLWRPHMGKLLNRAELDAIDEMVRV